MHDIGMRIAFVGKGGSGKTTIAALFVRFLGEKQLPVLAIDADINQHLGAALGLSEEGCTAMPQLGSHLPEIKHLLRGTNTRISSAEKMLKTTPPGTGSVLMRLQEKHPMWERFATKVGGAMLLATGQFGQEDIGIKCFHAKTGSVELLLNHTIDQRDEYIVVDMTAGADAFASGLFTRFDLTCMVVEPTKKSVGVFQQYASFAKEYGVQLALIANKIRNPEEIAWIGQETGQRPIAVFPESAYVRSMERGQMLPLAELEPEAQACLQEVKYGIDRVPKNWKRYLEQAKEFHIKNAISWGNAAVGEDVTKQIDPTFSYPEG